MARVDRDRAQNVPALRADFVEDRILQAGEPVLARAGNAQRLVARPVAVFRQIAFV